jgi:uncharacterized protein YhaN
MYLSALHIDGFGIYRDQGVQDLPPGLVIFLGDNEAGKTTLMEFVRSLLFGFPRRDKKLNSYEPVRGGNHGGRLQMVMQDGRRLTVARLARQPVTISQADGATIPGDPAAVLFGGLDRDTYRHVFAVGLEELQGLEVLDREGVRSSRLFAAGSGLGSASVSQLTRHLDKEMANLLVSSPRGQKQINRLVQELKATEAAIRDLQGQAAAYAQGHRQREELTARVEANRAVMDRLRRDLGRIERLEQARLPWVNRNRAREQAENLEYARDFPINGLERLERLGQDLEDQRRHRDSLVGEEVRLRTELSQLTLEEAVLNRQEDIEALASERERLVATLQDEPAARTDLEQARTEFLHKLRVLGPAWDELRLAQVDTSVATRQRVSEFARHLGAAERRGEEVRAREQTLAAAWAEAQREAESAAQRFMALPPLAVADPEALGQQQEALRRLRAWFHQRDLLTEQLRARVTAREESAARMAALKEQLADPAATLPWWLGGIGLGAGAALGGWLLYQRQNLAAGLIIGLGLLLAGLWFWWSRRHAGIEGRRRAVVETEGERLSNTQADLSAAITDLEARLQMAAGEIFRAAQALGREPPAAAAPLEDLAGELDQAAARLREWQAREEEQRRAADHLAQARSKREQARTEAAQAAQSLQDLETEWSAWLTQRGFSEPVRPEGFEAVLQAVENARSAARAVETQDRRVALIEDYLAAVRAKIGQVLRDCGRLPLGADPGVEDLDALRRALGAALATRQQQRELAGQLAAARRDLQALEGRLAELAQEREAWLRRAGAADEDDFRRRSAANRDWRDLMQQVETEETALRRMAGTREDQAALEAALRQADPVQLQNDQEGLKERIRELEKAISDDDQKIGDLKGKLQSLEQDRQLSAGLLKQRFLQEQLAAAVRRWATLAVCRHLLEEAREVYERERQPQVIQEADRFLHAMTYGRYRLLAAVGEEGIHLEDRSLARKAEPAWSAGLADQVYLAVRLGLAREFGRHSEPLPVILDDVLVKFDPGRRRHAARLILQYAREQQVLLFSCHPEFLEMIAAIRREPGYGETPVAGFALADGAMRGISLDAPLSLPAS